MDNKKIINRLTDAAQTVGGILGGAMLSSFAYNSGVRSNIVHLAVGVAGIAFSENKWIKNSSIGFTIETIGRVIINRQQERRMQKNMQNFSNTGKSITNSLTSNNNNNSTNSTNDTQKTTGDTINGFLGELYETFINNDEGVGNNGYWEQSAYENTNSEFGFAEFERHRPYFSEYDQKFDDRIDYSYNQPERLAYLEGNRENTPAILSSENFLFADEDEFGDLEETGIFGSDDDVNISSLFGNNDNVPDMDIQDLF
ncbi:MAG: hypothetical protein QXS90_00360 [Candidatus Diapherotrites archaeon]